MMVMMRVMMMVMMMMELHTDPRSRTSWLPAPCPVRAPSWAVFEALPTSFPKSSLAEFDRSKMRTKLGCFGCFLHATGQAAHQEVQSSLSSIAVQNKLDEAHVATLFIFSSFQDFSLFRRMNTRTESKSSFEINDKQKKQKRGSISHHSEQSSLLFGLQVPVVACFAL